MLAYGACSDERQRGLKAFCSGPWTLWETGESVAAKMQELGQILEQRRCYQQANFEAQLELGVFLEEFQSYLSCLTSHDRLYVGVGFHFLALSFPRTWIKLIINVIVCEGIAPKLALYSQVEQRTSFMVSCFRIPPRKE